MALWLTRAGKHGEHELKFLESGRVYFTWESLNKDLEIAKDLSQMYEIFQETYPDTATGTIQNWGRQGAQFALKMSKGDWVALPSKLNPVIHFGKIIGDYEFDASAQGPYYHSRKIDWFARDIPRDRFDQDILYSLGAFLTIAQIRRNNAEARIMEMANNGWSVPKSSAERTKTNVPIKSKGTSESIVDNDALESDADLAEIASDQIAKLVLAKYKGGKLAHLVKAILKAEGYEVYMPPEGPDKGVDLLAAPGNLGFGEPRICVQVKSGDSPVERTVLDQLRGVMENFNAERGLLVSWGGFKQTIEKERAIQFFRVRLWDRDDLLVNLYKNYDKLPESIRNELPLKRVWVMVQED